MKEFVPPEWREALANAASFPVCGPVSDPEGVVHELQGDHTLCGHRAVRSDLLNGPKLLRHWWFAGETPITCIECVDEACRPR